MTYFACSLTCILAAMISIVVMQVARTKERVGPMTCMAGGAVALVGILIPLITVVMISHLQMAKE